MVTLAATFYVGFGFAKLYFLYDYQFPESGHLDVTSVANPGGQSDMAIEFEYADLTNEKLAAKRLAMEKKIFGGLRTRALPDAEPMKIAQFVSRYVGAEIFDRYYRRPFEARNVSVVEISGTFDELVGYTWKSILLRQDRKHNGKLLIFHQGHDGSPFSFELSNTVIGRAIEMGYDVLALSMPGIGWNRIENVRIKTWDGWGILKGVHQNSHALFELVDTGAAHFIKFFIGPVESSIDFALSESAYKTVVMAGHSGGAWTTTLTAALDPRIDHSISYAGSLPFFARHRPKDLGDAEQYDVVFYRDFQYPTLYELASWAPGRHRVHYEVYSTGDSCCFDGGSTETLKKYLQGRPLSPLRDLRIAIVDNVGHHMVTGAFFDILEGLNDRDLISEMKRNQ